MSAVKDCLSMLCELGYSCSYNILYLLPKSDSKKLRFTALTHSPLNRPKPAILSILLCLKPDDFTREWGTPRSQWVKVNQTPFPFSRLLN